MVSAVLVCHTHNRYKVVKQLGDGTYGCVWKAANKQTGEVVRIATLMPRLS